MSCSWDRNPHQTLTRCVPFHSEVPFHRVPADLAVFLGQLVLLRSAVVEVAFVARTEMPAACLREVAFIQSFH